MDRKDMDAIRTFRKRNGKTAEVTQVGPTAAQKWDAYRRECISDSRKDAPVPLYRMTRVVNHDDCLDGRWDVRREDTEHDTWRKAQTARKAARKARNNRK